MSRDAGHEDFDEPHALKAQGRRGDRENLVNNKLYSRVEGDLRPAVKRCTARGYTVYTMAHGARSTLTFSIETHETLRSQSVVDALESARPRARSPPAQRHHLSLTLTLARKLHTRTRTRTRLLYRCGHRAPRLVLVCLLVFPVSPKPRVEERASLARLPSRFCFRFCLSTCRTSAPPESSRPRSGQKLSLPT